MPPKQSKQAKGQTGETTDQKLRRQANEQRADQHAWHCEKIATAVEGNAVRAKNVWFFIESGQAEEEPPAQVASDEPFHPRQ